MPQISKAKKAKRKNAGLAAATATAMHDMEALVAETAKLKVCLKSSAALVDDLERKLSEATTQCGALEAKLQVAVGWEKQLADKSLECIKAQRDTRQEALTLTASIKRLEAEKSYLSKQVVYATGEVDTCQHEYDVQLQEVLTKLDACQKRAARLSRHVKRVPNTLEHALLKAETTRSLLHLKEKGIYTEKVWDLVCSLVHAGVAAQNVGSVIHQVLAVANVTAVGDISRPSVAQIMVEGGVASKLQLAYELQEADGFTLIGSYSSDSPEPDLKTQVTHFLGIMPWLDASTKESIKDYEAILTNLTDLFNRSPFGKHQHSGLLQVVDILVNLTGMHSDYCAKEKKDAEALRKMKLDAREHILGEEAFLEMSKAELLPYFTEAHKKMIENAGGEEKWNSLSQGKQAESTASMLEGIIQDLGRESLELMSEEEKHVMKLFIWAGCGCHKDLNSMRGFYMALQSYYEEHPEVATPILLANQDNAAVLEDMCYNARQIVGLSRSSIVHNRVENIDH
ncbi:hypothetical protein FA15DRAFT_709969 [Coprinopsis marcescibilis]|uniref:Uncharacterized protein n=1 Tax=Coprinopsis marcescibilis TaxID=230819 RepID=A0A5C3KE04_COPMA|nr:hypothetical protein FA15DRAFT_709969 [Coprinopsis marcescibilis]